MTPLAQVGLPLLAPNHYMTASQYLLSPDGSYKLILQDDGNLAIYNSINSTLAWVADRNQSYSSTYNNYSPSLGLRFSVSNYAVLNDPSRVRQWAVGPQGNTDRGLIDRVHVSIQNDGNLVLLDLRSLWLSDTTKAFTPAASNVIAFAPGTSLVVGHLYKADKHSLVFQADGNLVVYDQAMTPIWSSGTDSQGGGQAVMQTDGNFVIYNAAGQAIWHTQTAGHNGAYALIQENGGFVIAHGTPVWARFGYTPGARPRVIYPGSTLEEWKTKNFTWTFF